MLAQRHGPEKSYMEQQPFIGRCGWSATVRFCSACKRKVKTGKLDSQMDQSGGETSMQT